MLPKGSTRSRPGNSSLIGTEEFLLVDAGSDGLSTGALASLWSKPSHCVRWRSLCSHYQDACEAALTRSEPPPDPPGLAVVSPSPFCVHYVGSIREEALGLAYASPDRQIWDLDDRPIKARRLRGRRPTPPADLET